jgi:hypothetical protein
MNHENVINMLSLWVTPDMWKNKALFAEIKAVINKLSESSYQLSERELFLTQELTDGLLEATISSCGKADETLKNELVLALNNIIKFQTFLFTGSDIH